MNERSGMSHMGGNVGMKKDVGPSGRPSEARGGERAGSRKLTAVSLQLDYRPRYRYVYVP